MNKVLYKDLPLGSKIICVVLTGMLALVCGVIVAGLFIKALAWSWGWAF